MNEKPGEPMGIIKMRVAGHLDKRWSVWLEGLAVRHDTDGTSLLSGVVCDQTALFGLLSRARDGGLTLLSLYYVAANAGRTMSATCCEPLPHDGE